MKILYLFLAAFTFSLSVPVNAQMSSTKDAQYLATIKAVANYKINDEEELRNVERLRQNERFNRDLQNMMSKLQNSKNKDSKNKKVLSILKAAGKEIYEILK